MVHRLSPQEGDSLMFTYALLTLAIAGAPRAPAPVRTLAGPPVQGRWSGTIPPASTADAPLRVVADVPLPGSASRFDYQSLESASGRLFISHMGAGQLVIFDVRASRVIANLDGFPTVKGVLAVPAEHRAYASATGSHAVAVVHDSTLQTVARVPGPRFPDGIAYAPEERRVFVSDESGRRDFMIDAATNSVVARIELDGEAGNTQYDAGSHCVIVAVQTANELAVIDPATATIVRRITLDKAVRYPHGVYIDAPHRLAFIAGQQLCRMSSRCDPPVRVMADHRVEDREQLPHAGGERDLGRFARCPQPPEERANDRIRARGGEGAHIQHGPHRRAPAPDEAFPAPLAAVAVERCDADEGRNLAAREPPEFGQLGEQGQGHHPADPRHAPQQVILRLPHRAGLDRGAELAVDIVEPALQPADVPGDVPPDGAAGELEAVRLGRQHLDELAPPREQGVEQLGGFARQEPGLGPHPLGKARQGPGVDRVGLRKLAERLREVPDVARIDHDDRQPHAGACGRHRQLVASGGLKDDQRRGQGRETADQLLNAGGIVCDDPGLAARLH